jgi:riboflavin synthase
MFTGIVEGLGTVQSVVRTGGGVSLDIRPDFALDNVRVGDSIAVSGACLTVVHFRDNTFSVDVAPETLSKSTLGQTKVGNKVNLERALRLGDRLSGHLVTGHVDGIATVKARRPAGNATIFAIGVSGELSRYIVQKGSVALDGISLTVNMCHRDQFEVSIIPHTAKQTTMGFKKVGDMVNVETDMIGKYVERFVQPFAEGTQEVENMASMDETVLKKAGFM